MKAFILFIALLLPALAQEMKTITLAVRHPGFESKKAEEHQLQVKLDKDGNPLGYFMDVKSVFCSDEKCDVITLAMEWDAIGHFVGYELPKGTQLTKYEHEPFKKADYAKFDKLMKNRGALIADLDIKEIVVEQKDPKKNTKKGSKEKPKDIAGKGDALQKVDAISGATPSYIQEEVVEGAAYTCYTMWHWAHGDTATQIRAHAQTTGTVEWLTGLLQSKQPDEVDFALEAVAKRDLQKAQMQQDAVAAATTCSMEGFETLIDYLAEAKLEPKSRYSAYQQVMAKVEGKQRVHLLEQLSQQKDAPPLSFFEHTAEQLPKIERFYELQLFLTLTEKHQAESDKLLTSIGKMLEHENFFFSRRTHTYLKDKKLPAAVKTSLEAYEKKHEGKL